MKHNGRQMSFGGPEQHGRHMGRICGIAVAVLMTAGLTFAGCGGAALAQIVEDTPVRRISVTLNKSKTLTFKAPFTTAVIGSPEIADLLPMTDHTLYVQGRKVGTTNISVFGVDKRLVAVIDLEVSLDAASLNGRIAASTGSHGIKVTSANGQVVLSGEASDATAAARAVDVARALSPKDAAGREAPVINAMRISATQQVRLKVRFLEVDRTAGRDLAVNFFGQSKNGNGLGVSGLGAVANSAASGSITKAGGGILGGQSIGVVGSTIQSNAGGGLTSATLVPLLSGLFAGSATTTPFGALLARVINTGELRVDGLISALEVKGLVKTLAEPDLIAQSGEKASFFAGAQVPVPTVQPGTVGAVPTVTVNYYPCGVTLNFVPTVLNTGLINMRLAPQVCQVSSTSSVIVNGTQIPELNTRSADTTVELRDGQSFAIAGLLQAQDINQLSQLPWLGNVPVLGALFRSTSYQKSETDLVVIVSAHLVKPVAPGQNLATPFDTTLPSNDIDLFLMSNTERKKRYTEFVTNGGDLWGPYGHILEAN